MDVETVNGRPMTIGQLSARTGVPVKALREYADSGLIYTRGRSPPDTGCSTRTPSGASASSASCAAWA